MDKMKALTLEFKMKFGGISIEKQTLVLIQYTDIVKFQNL